MSLPKHFGALAAVAPVVASIRAHYASVGDAVTDDEAPVIWARGFQMVAVRHGLDDVTDLVTWMLDHEAPALLARALLDTEAIHRLEGDRVCYVVAPVPVIPLASAACLSPSN